MKNVKKIAKEIINASSSFYRFPNHVFKDFPNAVIIDGDDDWFAPRLAHSEKIANEADIKILSLFQSGKSSISKSGIVIDKKQLKKFVSTFNELTKDDEWTNRTKPNFSTPEKPLRFTIKIIKSDNNEEKLSFISKGWIKETKK